MSQCTTVHPCTQALLGQLHAELDAGFGGGLADENAAPAPLPRRASFVERSQLPLFLSRAAAAPLASLNPRVLDAAAMRRARVGQVRVFFLSFSPTPAHPQPDDVNALHAWMPSATPAPASPKRTHSRTSAPPHA
jgi:hypothetical protein